MPIFIYQREIVCYPVTMRIGVVVHGAEAIDSGFALKAIRILERLGDVSVSLGGTMGRVAVIDHSLEDLIDITHRERPSTALQRLIDDEYDLVVLVNHGKMLESGIRFAELLLPKLNRKKTPLLIIEGAGAIGCIGTYDLLEQVASSLQLPLYHLSPRVTVEETGNRVVRRISGVHPGELIQINGVIIGRAVDQEIIVTTENKKITDVDGCETKPHGLEKLEETDLAEAIIRTGTPRQSPAGLRQIQTKRKEIAVLIDHDAESSLERAKNASVAVTVGDDTTAVAADILYRVNVPIIGITDGDRDGLIEETCKAPGSLVVRVKTGTDDYMGEQVRSQIFKDSEEIECLNVQKFKKNILKLLKGDIIEVVES